MVKKSVGERLMSAQLAGANVPYWQEEYHFCSNRKWRFDFAWPDKKVAFEIEGGSWSGGAHTRGKGFEEDIEKYNAAVILGWKVLRATTEHVSSGIAMIWVETVLK